MPTHSHDAIDNHSFILIHPSIPFQRRNHALTHFIDVLSLPTFSFFIFFVVILTFGGLTIYYMYRKHHAEKKKFAFLEDLQGSQFNFKLPPTIEEFYEVKKAAINQGWVPGQGEPSKEKTETPGRKMGQALMKRAISIVPIIHFMQKEGGAMNRLHQRNMCSKAQWRSFKVAETRLTEEVDEVKLEAEEIEPGWSDQIWSQAARYHQMLKQKQQEEVAVAQRAQAAQLQQQELANMKAEQERRRRMEIQKNLEDAKRKERDAEKMAKQLEKEEERSQDAKKGFKGVKKGFL